MPRGRKPSPQSTRELLAAQEAVIQSLKEELLEAKARKKELEEKLKQEELNQLYRAIQESGRPIADILQLLQAEPPQEMREE